MAAKDTGLRGQAPPALMVVVIVLLVLGLGAGVFYVFNGGWKTAAQQDEDYKHNLLPLMAAKHGDKAPLEAENKLRKEHGQPPLELPKDPKSGTANPQESLADLQKQLLEHQKK